MIILLSPEIHGNLFQLYEISLTAKGYLRDNAGYQISTQTGYFQDMWLFELRYLKLVVDVV